MWVMLAGAVFAVATALAVAAPGVAGRRRGVRMVVGVVATAAVNSSLLLGAHTMAVQILTLGTGAMLLTAVHRWAASVAAAGRGERPRDRSRAQGHNGNPWR